MAKTVAEIDGDSSGLVSALDKGKAGMKQLEAEGKKLSDQLKSVADDADMAAGNLVNKLGGPNAIKAIGAVGVAFAGAQSVIGAFMDSSEKLFQSYGDEGRKAWEDTEKKVFAVQGAFAAAVLGSDDLGTSAERMNTMLSLTKNAAELLFLPIKILTESFWTLGDNVERVGDLEEENIIIDNKYAAAIALTNKATVDMNAQFTTLLKNLGDVLYSKQQIADIELQTNLASIDAMIVNNDESRQFRANAAGDAAAAQAQAMAVDAAFQSKMRAARIELEADGDGRRRAIVGVAEVRARAKEMLLADKEFQAATRQQVQSARDQAIADNLEMTAEEKKRNEELLTIRENTAQRAAEIGVSLTSAAPRNTGSAGPTKPTETAEEKEARELKAINDLRLANTKGEQQMELDRMKWDDEQRDAKYEKDKAALEGQIAFGQQMLDDAAAERKAKGILTAEEEDALLKERLSKALGYVQDLAGQEMGIYMQNAGKQLALGKLTAKAASDMARSAIGNMIIGQGDKAMAEAGIMAAALNPLAVPMAAAGLAAYAIGNAMMPTAKPNAGSTPATEKPVEDKQSTGNSYAFNMRVDSVFADGESMARQFAMMQESARARGLLMQGA